MQQHPVPQNVTGYEFHLIGQMTLKQFLELAAGFLFAFLINTTNFPSLLKYLLMGVCVILGVALAFLPLEGRPLDRWFFALIKSIYQPTMFFWQKTDKVPEVFQYVQPTNVDTSPIVDLKPIRASRVGEYLQTVPRKADQTLDPEDQRAQEILALFTSPAPLPVQTTTGTVSPPPTVATVAEPIIGSTPHQETVIIPAPPSLVRLEPAPVVTPATVASSSTPTGSLTEVQSATPKAEQTAAPAQTDISLPFPSKPTQPNMVVGMVVSPEKKILDNAIVTIQTPDETPVRALKTNLLGQFGIITPLENGTYIITVEKDGYHFDNTSLVLNNQVVDPILIQAKA